MKLHIKLLFRKLEKTMFFQDHVTVFRIALYATIETKYLNSSMKLLSKTGWLNDKSQNISIGQRSLPKQVVSYGERPLNLSQTLNQEHSTWSLTCALL